MTNITMIGLDIAKNVFEAVCLNQEGKMVMRMRLKRSQVLGWFAKQVPCVVGMEACCGAHYWAREITKLGHKVRVLPPQHVKPYIRTNKSDTHDALAICRALQDPEMTSVSIADSRRQDLQALHRMRSLLIRERTAWVNQMRGFLLERGISLPKSIHRARAGVRAILQNPPASVSLMFRSLLEEQYRQLCDKDDLICRLNEENAREVEQDDSAKRVMEVLGVGALTASALVLKICHAGAYRNGRHFSASLGLVPRHEGTGERL